MKVNSHNPEFGYELISVIPYAYWLHSKGLLTETVSGYDSGPLYYFSPKHTINPEPRSWYNVEKMTTPNRDIHKSELDLTEFKSPPYEKIFRSNYRFDIMVCNRHNREWPGNIKLDRPINYFSIDWLDAFFKKNSDKKIAYLNIEGFERHYDNSHAIKIPDYELCKQHDNVFHVRDLYEGGSLNELQLKMMAGCKEFYTLNGGYSILASFFGGKNYIYTKKTLVDGRIYPRELETGDFGYYHHFGGSEIILREL